MTNLKNFSKAKYEFGIYLARCDVSTLANSGFIRATEPPPKRQWIGVSEVIQAIKLRPKKEKRFYFKNGLVGSFFFLHSVHCHLDTTILYTDTQHLKKKLFLMNISKEHCFVMRQWERRR